jgi:hypothetical protein
MVLGRAPVRIVDRRNLAPMTLVPLQQTVTLPVNLQNNRPLSSPDVH